jgi:hypothetical protein
MEVLVALLSQGLAGLEVLEVQEIGLLLMTFSMLEVVAVLVDMLAQEVMV